MITLKTDTYEEFLSACEAAGLVDDGVISTSSFDYQLCLIGTLYEGTGSVLTDVDGNEYNEQVPTDGYHANLKLRGDYLTGIEHLAIDCDTPKYKFAGE